MAIGELHVSVKADIADIRSALNTIRKEQDKMADAIKGVGSTQEKAFGGMAGNIQKIGSAIASSFVVQKIADFGRSILGLSGDLEQNRVAFTTMLGSAEKANLLLKQLSDFAKKTPFELIGLREQTKSLLAYQFSAEEIIPTLRSLGNIAAGIGMDKLPRLTYALGQVKAAGVLLGQDFKQFTETGFGLGEALQKVTGITSKITPGNVAELGITYEQVAQAIKLATSEGGTFYNLLDAQSKTLLGSVSNLSDNWSSLLTTIGDLFRPMATEIVQKVSDIVGAVQTRSAEHPTLTKAIAITSAALAGLVVVIGGLTVAGVALAPVLAAITSGAALMGISFTAAGVAVGAVTFPIRGVIAAVTAAVGAVVLLYKAYQTNFGGMKDVVDGWAYNIRIVVKAVTVLFEFLKQKIKDSLTFISGLYEGSKRSLNDRLNNITFGLYGVIKTYILTSQRTKAFVDSIANYFKGFSVLNTIMKTVMDNMLNIVLGPLGMIMSAVKDVIQWLGKVTGIAAAVDEDIRQNAARAMNIQSPAAPGKIVFTDANASITAPSSPTNLGGGGKGSGKSSKDKAAEEEKKKQEELMQNESEKRAIGSEFRKEQEKLRIRAESIKKYETLDKDQRKRLEDNRREQEKLDADHNLALIQNAIDRDAIEGKITKERAIELKNLAKVRSDASQESAKGINESIDAMDDYKNKIEETIKKFSDLKKQATDDLRQINQSLADLDSQKEKDIANRYVQVVNSLATETDATKRNQLEQERQLILQTTNQTILDQAVAYDKLSETQKLIQKNDEERAILLEKQAIAQAVSNQVIPTDGTPAQSPLSIDPETNKVFYENEKGSLIEITNVKNQEYARDLLNKQIAIQQELADEQHMLDIKKGQYDGYVASKKIAEGEFTKFVKTQTDMQLGYVNSLIKAYQAAAVARASAMGQASTLPLKKFAKGGDVIGGEPIIVGDGGRPEVFVPGQSGMIVPSIGEYMNDVIGYMQSVTNKVMRQQMERQAQTIQNISQDKSMNFHGDINTGDLDGFKSWMEAMRRRLK